VPLGYCRHGVVWFGAFNLKSFTGTLSIRGGCTSIYMVELAIFIYLVLGTTPRLPLLNFPNDLRHSDSFKSRTILIHGSNEICLISHHVTPFLNDANSVFAMGGRIIDVGIPSTNCLGFSSQDVASDNNQTKRMDPLHKKGKPSKKTIQVNRLISSAFVDSVT
jgi:hypothetical protein